MSKISEEAGVILGKNTVLCNIWQKFAFTTMNQANALLPGLTIHQVSGKLWTNSGPTPWQLAQSLKVSVFAVITFDWVIKRLPVPNVTTVTTGTPWQ